MNKDQFMSFIRSILQGGGGALVATGVLSSSFALDWTGALLVLAGLIWGQVHHSASA